MTEEIKNNQQQYTHEMLDLATLPYLKLTLNFCNNVESLEQSYNLFVKAAKDANEAAFGNFANFILSVFSPKDAADALIGQAISMFDKHGITLQKMKKQLQHTKHAVEVIRKSLLIILVSEFDHLIAGLIRYMLTEPKGGISRLKTSISIMQLSKLPSKDAAINYLIGKRIESIMRKSHTFHFEWIERQLNTTLRSDQDFWPHFIEITERRNLFVHTDGVVSSQYLQVCEDHKVFEESTPPQENTKSLSHKGCQAAVR